MNKTIRLSLLLGFGAMALLYIIGFVANIDSLKFSVSSTNTEIALLPIAIGLFITVISARIVKFND